MKTLFLTIAGAVCAAQVMATPIAIDTVEDFETAGNNGWSMQSGNIGGGTLIGSSGVGGYLGLQFQSGAATPEDAILYAPTIAFPGDSYQFTGDFGSIVGLYASFKFRAFNDPVNPTEGLQLYFKGATRTWLYDVTLQAASTPPGWVTISAPLGVYGGSGWSIWNFGVGTYSEWQTDFANVTEFGILVAKDPSLGSTPLYGLDDVVLTQVVPEPETVWLLMAALASLAVTFRGRIGATVRRALNRA